MHVMKANTISWTEILPNVFLTIAKRLALLADLTINLLALNAKEVYSFIKINAFNNVREMVYMEISKLDFARNALKAV